VKTRILCLFLLLAPMALTAQAPKKPQRAAPRKTVEVAKREFGADLSAFYQHVSSSGGTLNHVVAVAPLDVRVGFPVGEYASVEPRASFSYDSRDGGSYTVSPDLNVTYGIFGGENGSGYYATAGAGVVVTHAANTASQAQFNAGIGRRTGPLRAEAFLQDVLQNKADGLPNRFNIGVRLGLSIWS
jgi:hypothetical protein